MLPYSLAGNGRQAVKAIARLCLFACIAVATGGCARRPAPRPSWHPHPAKRPSAKAVAQARPILEEVIPHARTLFGSVEDWPALSSLIFALACVDPQRALKLAYQIGGDGTRGPQGTLGDDLVENITRALGEINPDQGLEIVRGIEERESAVVRDFTEAYDLTGLPSGPALKGLAEGVAAKDPQWAFQAAVKAERRYPFHDALEGIIRAIGPAHPDLALKAALSVHDPETTRETCLLAVAETAASRPSGLPVALKAARSMAPKWRWRAPALAAVADAMWKTDPRRGRDVAREALEAVPRINEDEDPEYNGLYRAEALCDIGVVLAKRDPPWATRVMDRALHSAEHIPDRWQHDVALQRVVRALAKDAPDRALRVARRIRDAGDRAEAFADVAAASVKARPELARRVADEAFLRAAALPDNGRILGFGSFGTVARTIAQADPQMALAAARRVKEAQAHDVALQAAALVLAKTQPERALKIAQTITNEDQRAEVLENVAVTLAKSDDVDRGLRLARSIKEPRFRARALSRIVRVILAPQDKARWDAW